MKLEACLSRQELINVIHDHLIKTNGKIILNVKKVSKVKSNILVKGMRRVWSMSRSFQNKVHAIDLYRSGTLWSSNNYFFCGRALNVFVQNNNNFTCVSTDLSTGWARADCSTCCLRSVSTFSSISHVPFYKIGTSRSYWVEGRLSLTCCHWLPWKSI